MQTRWMLTICLVLLIASPGLAQNHLKGKLELSTGGSFQAITFSESGYSETVDLINIPIRAGYFLTDALELELEGVLSVWDEDFSFDDESELATVWSANAAYNFPTRSNVRPFLLAGIGVTDAAMPPLGNAVILTDADETTRPVLNLGAGFKTMVGDRAALRVEYRLQSVPEDEDEWHSGWTSHTIQLGVSMFLL